MTLLQHNLMVWCSSFRLRLWKYQLKQYSSLVHEEGYGIENVLRLISCISLIKYLERILDSKLRWKKHVDLTTPKTIRYLAGITCNSRETADEITEIGMCMHHWCHVHLRSLCTRVDYEPHSTLYRKNDGKEINICLNILRGWRERSNKWSERNCHGQNLLMPLLLFSFLPRDELLNSIYFEGRSKLSLGSKSGRRRKVLAVVW